MVIHLQQQYSNTVPLDYDIYVNNKLHQTYKNKKAKANGISQSLDLTIKDPKL